MGWIKKPIRGTKDIFNDLVKVFGKKWNGRIGSSSSPYEYFSDYIRDYYDVTLKQCDLLCKMLKEHYQIEQFYYDEMKRK
jgi:hypothetical protein